ncbi:PorP/SprF family type IX secretion system membrane protein, partial [Flavobacterium jumunjinense]
MKNLYLGVILCMLSTVVFSQENAYSSFDVSLNNSIKLNRFLINPAFSYAREVAPSINLANKRQWVKFEDAPVLYFLNYQGRLSNESRFGIGVYSQSTGLLKNNGGLLNYSLNVPMEDEKNLTFGVNVYFSSSNLDKNRAITETTEPLFNELSATSLISVKPGLNLRLNNFDIGIAANNIISYNLSSSEAVQENNSSSFSGHLMYTKEISSFYNILDGSNFSTMIQLENRKDGTAISGNLLIDQRDLGWLEAGYNTSKGVNAGIGAAISKKFFIGYSYNLAISNSLFFGSSHEFSLSYSFTDYDDSYNFRDRAQKIREKTAAKRANKETPKTDKASSEADKADKDQARKDRIEELRIQREAAKQAREDKINAAKEAADAKANAQKENNVEVEENNQAEKDRLAKEAAEKEQAEKDRLAIEAANSQAEKDRLAKEAAEKAQAEKDRLAREAAEKAQAEKDRLAREAAERAQAEKDRLAREAQAEKDRLA